MKRKPSKDPIVGSDSIEYFQNQNLTREQKAYLIMRFIILLHRDDKFIIAQKFVDKSLDVITNNDLFPVIEKINLKEFCEVSKDVFTMDVNYLAGTIKEIEKSIPEPMVVHLDRIVRNATKKKNR